MAHARSCNSSVGCASQKFSKHTYVKYIVYTVHHVALPNTQMPHSHLDKVIMPAAHPAFGQHYCRSTALSNQASATFKPDKTLLGSDVHYS